MQMLIAAAAVFLGIHLLIAGTRLRDGITGVIGERAYLGLFSLASIAVIVWLCMAYNTAGPTAENVRLYSLGEGVHDLGIVIVGLAFFIGVQGFFIPSPTAVGQESALGKESAVQGVTRITRHPFLWGVAIWAAFHLAVNGDTASIILFGTFLVLSILGTFSIDAKRKRKFGAAWEGYAAKTSNIPFAAVLSGRGSLKLGELFGWRFLIAAVLFLIVLFAHARVIGVSPFPGGYVPF